MALKRILESLEGVPADVAKEYKEVDGKFVLDLEGDDLTPLVAAKTREKEAHNATKQLLQEAKDALDEMRRGAIPKTDVEGLENSWKEKLEAEKGNTKKVKAQLDKATRMAAAERVAGNLTDSPDLLMPIILGRLVTEDGDEDTINVRVKGLDGKLSALTLDELENELRANPKFSAIIRGSQGQGGGAHQARSGGGATQKKLADLSESERVALFRTNPTEFNRLVTESKAAQK